MSDNFFSGLSRWWNESWQAGVNAPSFGPKVGRGLFSNWFLTERERELEELAQLYFDTVAAHNEIAFADGENPSFGATIDTLRPVFDAYPALKEDDLIEAVARPIEAMLEEEFFWFPKYERGEFGPLDLKTQVELREFLLHRQRQCAAFGEFLMTGQSALRDISEALLERASDAGIEATGADQHALTLSMPIAGMLEDLPAVLSRTVYSLCADTEPVSKAGLFGRQRIQLMRNLRIASGINPDNPNNTRPYVFPTDAKFETPLELVEIYLEHTPLQDLFEAPVPITIPDQVRREHALIVGGSGHGKTQALLHLIHHDLSNRTDTPPSVIVIDSQGDLIHTIARLDCFDPEQEGSLADRLILIDPSDVEFPVALNLFAFDQDRLDTYTRGDRERVLNSVIDLFDYFFSTLLGAELTQKQGVVFKYLARLMLVIPDATIQTLSDLMENGNKYRHYMERLDGSARKFFRTEFFSRSFAATKQQIQRRLWGVLSNPVFERMFSHPENKVDLFEAMNEGKIILINTAKDHLKAEGCSIFGRFFLAKIAQAALERATIPEDERRTTMLYIDEAHDYFDETLEHLFAQSRKFGVAVHVATQALDVMPSRLRSVVLSSTALKFAGGVSSKDARALADDMNTDADFIRSMRKRRGKTEFAVHVRNRTTSAIQVNFELGAVNAKSTLNSDGFQTLVEFNRQRYCATIEEVWTAPRKVARSLS